ncbi:MAG: insulinase family protein [Clostridia bacterium]|jgi:Zn-dependent M16 (insulinase) family peptidase|nr:insulinase family protein [Clostridia bacterium]
MNNFDKEKVTAGFRLLKKEKINDIDSVCHVFLHEKSGAKLFYAQNKDINKVFFISLKTPPSNDCGCAHIMEHSVLCGSEKYPVKDPFNELEKGSLNTYLNALTYADKTMYPIASCNEKDFENLFKVYADAVFKPNVLKEKKIFMQEGWHYELESPESELKLNGVVYNEMKGALSQPERVLENLNSRSLFGKTVYGFESGGEPDAIPELTFKDFCDFYNQYYYPSNSFIYLYGDMDAEKYMKYLSENYLNNYENDKEKVRIPVITKSFQKYAESSYSIGEGTKRENDSYFSLNFATGLSTDIFMQFALEVLSYVLFETNGSPVKHKLIESGLCEDLEGWFDNSAYQMTLNIVGKNCRYEDRDKFKTLVIDTLRNVSENGIDKKLITSAINYIEFVLREADFGYKPKGLAYGMRMMYGWLNGADAIESIKMYCHFDKMRKEAENGLFERLIKEYILENEHSSFTVIKAEEGLQAKNDSKTAEKLREIKSKMNDTEIKQIIKEAKELKEYQSAPEKKEDLKKVPCLTLNEVDKKIKKLNTEKTKNGILTVHESNGIFYVKIMFSLDTLPKELISAASLLAECIGSLDTEKYGYADIPGEIAMYTGGIYAKCEVYERDGEIMPVLSVYGKALERNAGKLFELMDETVLKMNFNAADSLKKIIKELKIRIERTINENGHIAAVFRALSFCKKEYAYREYLRGITFSDFISKAEKDTKTLEMIKKAAELIFSSDNVVSSVLCEESFKDNLNDMVSKFYEKMPVNKDKKLYPFDFEPASKSEGIITSSKVVYNAKAADFKKLGFKYSGKMNVLKNIINTEYLWNEVRVKGGAYGCGCVFSRNGNLYFYSYRDPKVKSTFDIYNNTAEFIEKTDFSKDEIEKYTLGAVNEIDRPKSSTEILEMSTICFMNDITDEMLQKSRDEMLSVNLDDIHSFSRLLKTAMSKKNIVTIGNEGKINENKDLFDTVRNLNVR